MDQFLERLIVFYTYVKTIVLLSFAQAISLISLGILISVSNRSLMHMVVLYHFIIILFILNSLSFSVYQVFKYFNCSPKYFLINFAPL